MITIIDYEIGNTLSVKNAIDKLGYKSEITNKKSTINKSSHIILPGVGSFEKGMFNLKKYKLIETLNEEILIKKKKFLGICLGFQLMCKTSEEFGVNKGLGWLDLRVTKIKSNKLRLPHVGWNIVKIKNQDSIFFNKIDNEKMFYFNHSYAIKNSESSTFSDVMTCNYGEDFIAALKYNNLFGIQPHPEKSQKQGLQVIKNFIEY
mgnify:FL=1